jgi:hypothetical protein
MSLGLAAAQREAAKVLWRLMIWTAVYHAALRCSSIAVAVTGVERNRHGLPVTVLSVNCGEAHFHLVCFGMLMHTCKG